VIRHLSLVGIGAVLLATTLSVSAQSIETETFKGRLSAFPIDFVTATTTTGSGSATATLTGDVLTIAGAFEGLNSAATSAYLSRAQKGMRGPRVFPLTVTRAISGTIDGRFTLTPAQVQDLRRGWYIVQIQTAANPEGHLRTWLSRVAP
jgi:hypothetical protein